MTDTTDDEQQNGWDEARDELRRAYLLVSFGNYDEAIEACHRADDLVDGSHHLPKTLEGNFLVSRGDVRAAIKTLRKVTKSFPDETLPQIHFAEACYFGGRKRQGDRALKKAKDLDDGEYREMIDELEAAWEDVEPDEIPPPLEVGDSN